MQNKIIYLKNFLKVLIWPILFELGQFLILFIFTIIFNNQYIKILEQQFPNLTNKELENKLIKSVNTIDYQNQLDIFLDKNLLIMIIISFILITPLFIIVFKKINNDKKLNIPIKKIIIIITISIILAVSLNLIIYGINYLYPFTDRYDDNKLLWPIFISTGILGPIIEELVFRGVLYNKLKKFNSTKASMIITTILFAIIHFEISQLFYTLIIGYFLVYLYEKYQNIKIPILAHIIINTSTLILVSTLI